MSLDLANIKDIKRLCKDLDKNKVYKICKNNEDESEKLAGCKDYNPIQLLNQSDLNHPKLKCEKKCCPPNGGGGGSECPVCVPAGVDWGSYIFWDPTNPPGQWTLGGESIYVDDPDPNNTYTYYDGVRLGYNAGRVNSANNDSADSIVAIGSFAGESNQSGASVAIGYYAGQFTQSFGSVAIGYNAGQKEQKDLSIAIGYYAGASFQSNRAIAVGSFAGQNNQSQDSIAIGSFAGQVNQSSSSIAIGVAAGITDQSNNSVAIGTDAGRISQRSNSIAFGNSAGRENQGLESIAIGTNSGCNNQGTEGGNAIALGSNAGRNNQGENSIAIGIQAGCNNQGTISPGERNAIAIGSYTARNNQGKNTIAMGNTAGDNNQGELSIAIGTQSGQQNQGCNAIAIGKSAGESSQCNNTIVINATGGVVNGNSFSNACYIAPIRPATGDNGALQYISGTREVVWNTNKTFVIPHPTQSNKYLQHACLEGPEAGVYYRGHSEIKNDLNTIIELPDYADKIAKNFTIHLNQKVNFDEEKVEPIVYTASDIKDNKFKVFGKNGKFDWVVYGERHSIEVEPPKTDYTLHGDGPYTYLTKN